MRPCSKSSRALNDSHCLPVSSIASTGWPARMFSPTSATITLTTPSAGARRMVLSSRRSSTASADAAAWTCASAMARSSLVGPATRGGVIGFRFGDVGARARHVVLGLVERSAARRCRCAPGRRCGRAALPHSPAAISPWRSRPRARRSPPRARRHRRGRGRRSRRRAPRAPAPPPRSARARRARRRRRRRGRGSPFWTLIAASWPPTSGATRISVARTTPTIGARRLGAPQKISADACRDQRRRRAR